MTLQSVTKILSSISSRKEEPAELEMTNTFTTPPLDNMEPEYFELIPSVAWNTAYLSVPGVLPLATRINPQRVLEVFTSIPSPVAQHMMPPQPPPPARILGPAITPYDGRPESLRAFCSQLLNQLQEQDHAFPTESSKVRFAFQCLGPGALAKMRSSFRCLEDPSIAPVIENISDFLVALKRQCQDPGLQDKATRAVESMTQGNQTFYDFITSFEDNMCDSIYADLDKSTWKIMLERRLSFKMRDVLLSASDAPNEYHEFVAYLRKKDAVYQEMRATFRAAKSPGRPSPSHFPNITNNPYSNPRPAMTPRVPTVSQGGSAMDLDSISQQRLPDGHLTEPARAARLALGRCLRCNEAGHIAVNCHLKNRAIASASVVHNNQETVNQLKEQL